MFSKNQLYLLILLTGSMFFLCGCLLNPAELQADPRIQKSFAVSKKVQEVYRDMNDKAMRCEPTAGTLRQGELYPALGEGEIRFMLPNTTGVVVYVRLKQVDDKTTVVDMYGAYDSPGIKLTFETLRRGAMGEPGCPK